ncbi:MAG: chemotaxis protein CheX [Spirochaetaceae bacterium]|jgi:chemotaxis protein CheX|nr:chemotaxis protein CheX [Spirochaetaceae bacterium]
MDRKYLDPFINATLDVFEDFFQLTPSLKNPYLINRKEAYSWQLSSVIGIGGDSRGVVVISFTQEMARLLTSRLSTLPGEPEKEDILDTIGEVVNIIAGNAKKGLEEYRLVISLPSIIHGNSPDISWPGKHVPIVGIPFSIPQGDFLLAVGLENIIKG